MLIIANTNFDAANACNTGPFEFTYYLSNDPRDQTYTLTPIGIYFGYNVSDPGNWLTWFIVGKKVTIASAKVGKPFPNPLIVGSSVTMQIPVSSPGQVTGTLSIFTSSMDLIYSSRLTSTALISGQQAFAWGGMTNKGRVTQSGIYYYVLDLEGQRYSGKFAILRK